MDLSLVRGHISSYKWGWSSDGGSNSMLPTPCLMLSAPLRAELQLRGGGPPRAVPQGARQWLPQPTKLHYLGLALWLPDLSQGPVRTQGHGSLLLVA